MRRRRRRHRGHRGRGRRWWFVWRDNLLQNHSFWLSFVRSFFMCSDFIFFLLLLSFWFLCNKPIVFDAAISSIISLNSSRTLANDLFLSWRRKKKKNEKLNRFSCNLAFKLVGLISLNKSECIHAFAPFTRTKVGHRLCGDHVVTRNKRRPKYWIKKKKENAFHSINADLKIETRKIFENGMEIIHANNWAHEFVGHRSICRSQFNWFRFIFHVRQESFWFHRRQAFGFVCLAPTLAGSLENNNAREQWTCHHSLIILKIELQKSHPHQQHTLVGTWRTEIPITFVGQIVASPEFDKYLLFIRNVVMLLLSLCSDWRHYARIGITWEKWEQNKESFTHCFPEKIIKIKLQRV